jgi:hypothetical protein
MILYKENLMPWYRAVRHQIAMKYSYCLLGHNSLKDWGICPLHIGDFALTATTYVDTNMADIR